MTVGSGQLPAFDFRDENLPPVQSVDYGRFPTPIVVALLIIAYCLLQYVIRLLVSPVFPADEADILLMSQSVDLGYRLDRPPAPIWLFSLVDMLIGLSRPVFFAVKYALMAIGLLVFYSATRIVFRWFNPETNFLHDRFDLSAACVAAFALFFQTGWINNVSSTYEVFSFVVLAGVLHSFFAALASQSRRDWTYFGVMSGLCLLSAWHAFILPLSLLLAAFSIAEISRGRADRNDYYQTSRLPLRLLMFALLGFLLALAPLVTWFVLSGLSPLELLSLIPSPAGPPTGSEGAQELWRELFQARQNSAISLFQALIAFVIPMPVIFALLFWPMWLPYAVPFLPRRKVEEDESEIIWRNLVGRTIFYAIAILVTASLAGAMRFDVRWMAPVLIISPIWFFLQVQRSGPYFISMRGYVAVIFIAVTAVSVARFLDWNQRIETCVQEECDSYIPVRDWAEALELEGFRQGTIIGAEVLVTGNLRHAFPHARVLDATHPLSTYPAPSIDRGACVAVWRDEPQMPDLLADYLSSEMDMSVPSTSPQGAIQRDLMKAEFKTSELYYRYLPPNEHCQ